jgi:DNA-binding CsgD family transcriptional regulator
MHHQHLAAAGARAPQPIEQPFSAPSISRGPFSQRSSKPIRGGGAAVMIDEAERRFWQSLVDGRGRWDNAAQAASVWSGLVSGHWVVADAARSQGLYAAVVRQIRPSERVVAMPERSRDVLEKALRGVAQKTIALDRPQPTTPSAVSQTVRRELGRFGLRSRSELLLLCRGTTGAETPPGLRVATFHSQHGPIAVLVASLAVSRVDAPLSTAEREVTQALIEGRSNKEIAARRGRSPHAVANQVASILAKLKVPSRYALIAGSSKWAPMAAPPACLPELMVRRLASEIRKCYERLTP